MARSKFEVIESLVGFCGKYAGVAGIQGFTCGAAAAYPMPTMRKVLLGASA